MNGEIEDVYWDIDGNGDYDDPDDIENQDVVQMTFFEGGLHEIGLKVVDEWGLEDELDDMIQIYVEPFDTFCVNLIDQYNSADSLYGTRTITCLTALTIKGGVLWQHGAPSPANGHTYSDLPVQIYDWDGDGRNEVVTLEGEYAAGRGGPAARVNVWRWNGFGFTMDWRSPLGVLRQLRLTDVDNSSILDIVVR